MADEATSNGVNLHEHSDVIDWATFEQILEMDEEPSDREFSQGIVFDFFEQAHKTFEEMDEALVDQDLAALSAKGHFLKGSSATIGFTKVKDSCEKIQNIGARKDASGMKDEPDDKKSLNLLKDIVETTKEELDEVETIMKQWFGED